MGVLLFPLRLVLFILVLCFFFGLLSKRWRLGGKLSLLV